MAVQSLPTGVFMMGMQKPHVRISADKVCEDFIFCSGSFDTRFFTGFNAFKNPSHIAA